MSDRRKVVDRPPALTELPAEQQVLLAAWFVLALADPFTRGEEIPDRSCLRAVGALARTARIRGQCRKRAPTQTALSNRRRDPRPPWRLST
jgi:hypothetical protein